MAQNAHWCTPTQIIRTLGQLPGSSLEETPSI
jgi:hypothetical protein